MLFQENPSQKISCVYVKRETLLSCITVLGRKSFSLYSHHWYVEKHSFMIFEKRRISRWNIKQKMNKICSRGWNQMGKCNTIIPSNIKQLSTFMKNKNNSRLPRQELPTYVGSSFSFIACHHVQKSFSSDLIRLATQLKTKSVSLIDNQATHLKSQYIDWSPSTKWERKYVESPLSHI